MILYYSLHIIQFEGHVEQGRERIIDGNFQFGRSHEFVLHNKTELYYSQTFALILSLNNYVTQAFYNNILVRLFIVINPT